MDLHGPYLCIDGSKASVEFCYRVIDLSGYVCLSLQHDVICDLCSWMFDLADGDIAGFVIPAYVVPALRRIYSASHPSYMSGSALPQ